MLLSAGCEGYYKDLAAHSITYYLSDGTTHTERLTVRTPAIPEVFDRSTLLEAIRAAQRDEIRYPKFVVRAVKAGTAAYRVHITGRRVLYLGRQGDIHIEYFPQAKP